MNRKTEKFKKIFSGTTLIVTGGTYIVLIGLFAFWFCASMAFSFAEASQQTRANFNIIIVVSMVLTLIVGFIIITIVIKKVKKQSPLLSIIGYLILTFGVWLSIWASITIWNSTLGMRQNLTYQKVLKKGELVLEYHSIYNNENHIHQCYYLDKKLYFITKKDEIINNIFVSHIRKDINTSYYLEIYEKNNKYILLYKEDNANLIGGVTYSDYMINLKDVGLFDFYGMENMLMFITDDSFDNLGLTVLNEEIHDKLRKRNRTNIK